MFNNRSKIVEYTICEPCQLAIVTDAHINSDQEIKDFLVMLDEVAKKKYPILFLGDIFELWLAIDKYELSWHKQFKQWCEKQSIELFFIEGNHEFFANFNCHGKYFKTDSKKYFPNGYMKIDNVFFGHGDLINEKEKWYLRFKIVTRNPIAYFIARYFPFAEKLVALIQKKMTKKKKQKYNAPWEIINTFTTKVNKENSSTNIFCLGHYHIEEKKDDKIVVNLLPDWQTTNKIALINTKTGEIEVEYWKKLINPIN